MGDPSGSGSGGEEGEGAVAKAEEKHKEHPCLLRATDGKGKQSKVKISTLVSRPALCTRAVGSDVLLERAAPDSRPLTVLSGDQRLSRTGG